MNGKNIDMYLIAGQSNAAGYSYHNGNFGEVFDGIWYAGETDRSLDGKTLRSSNLSSFENFCFAVKAGLGTFDNRMGPEYGMAKVFTENGVYGKDNPCIIFKSAAGGTSLQNSFGGESANYGNWYPRSLWEEGFTPDNSRPTGVQYNNFVNNFKKVYGELVKNGYQPKVKGMVWMQGCTDLGSDKEYEGIIKVFIADIRKDISDITGDKSCLKMPFVIGKIPTTVCVHNNPNTPAFNEMQERVAKSVENVYTVETKDLIIVKADGTFSGVDPHHFAGEDMLTLGTRFGKKLLEANK
ncbi:MAG: hypothetical protein IJ706_06400 [Clostridia bacterium]|nr:hypothetical protein [Clostridia bacterium]